MLLGYEAILIGNLLPTFLSSFLPPSGGWTKKCDLLARTACTILGECLLGNNHSKPIHEKMPWGGGGLTSCLQPPRSKEQTEAVRQGINRQMQLYNGQTMHAIEVRLKQSTKAHSPGTT